jgi:hypothetical protein
MKIGELYVIAKSRWTYIGWTYIGLFPSGYTGIAWGRVGTFFASGGHTMPSTGPYRFLSSAPADLRCPIGSMGYFCMLYVVHSEFLAGLATVTYEMLRIWIGS